MKERFITFVCALGALALFFTMFMHQDPNGFGGGEVPRPTTEERGGNGYQAAMQWLDGQHIRTISLRERYDRLPKKELSATGNILIVTLPATAFFKTEEFRPLDHWVRSGNTLVVLAALSDTPDWAFSFGGMTSGDLNLLTGLEFESTRIRDSRVVRKAAESRAGRVPSGGAATTGGPSPSGGALTGGGPAPGTGPEGKEAIVRLPTHYPQGKRETLVPNREHAYFKGVQQVIGLTDYESQPWAVKVPYEGFVLALGRERESGEGVFWARPLGNGRIVVSGLGTIFTNRVLGLADNARLLSNIVATNLGPGGAVLFDDVHQGLGANYDPVKFYRDPRLHVTIAIVATLWLSWVLGGTRLRLPTIRTPVPREAELVRATGGFLARVLTPAAAARRMFDHFLARRPWAVLERQSRIAATDLAQLKFWYSQVGTARIPLVRLHNLMAKINRQLHS